MLAQPNAVYELLLDHARSEATVSAFYLGLVWSLCKTQQPEGAGFGLAMSPQIAIRTLTFPGTLVGKTLAELATWITEWDFYRATVGMAAINCAINCHPFATATPLAAGNLAVFEHFLPQLQGKKVVIIGRYPGIERYANQVQLSILERQPQANDYPDPAAEFLLPQADWVFISGSTFANKTFPRLAQLAQHASTVLMGPSVPWLSELAEFGINYLAGVAVADGLLLEQTVAQGGGVRIFEHAVRYHLAKLS
jgi:hypothetical protein